MQDWIVREAIVFVALHLTYPQGKSDNKIVTFLNQHIAEKKCSELADKCNVFYFQRYSQSNYA